jgi:hypothetical protein
MISKIESGINTYLNNFNRLINICEGFGTAYNPSAVTLKIDSLKYQAARVQGAINAVDTALPAYLTAENTRRAKFALLPPLATRVQSVAIASALPAAIIVHIKEVVRKIRGKRAHAIESDTTGIQPVDDPTKHISVSQQSFIEQAEHFNQLIALVASQTAYDPAENDLKVGSLNYLLAEMRAANNAVLAAIVPLATARQERNKQLYTPTTGMMDTGLTVKEYVKGVFGAASPQYKEVRSIKFVNRKI